MTLLLLAAACPGVSIDAPSSWGRWTTTGPAGATTSGTTATGQPTTTVSGTATPEHTCDDIPPLPGSLSRLPGFSGAEDFAFDGAGYLVSVDGRGNLVARDREGDEGVILPGLGTTAGTRFLPDGQLVVASVTRGAIERIGLDGSRVTLAAGFSYPNGLDVDLDGSIYVADQSSQQLVRVDPDTGEKEVVATGLPGANGVSFDPTYGRIYVGSFGDGRIRAVDKDGLGGFLEPFVVADVEDLVLPDMCSDAGMSEGDPCYLLGGGYGTCRAEPDGLLLCTSEPDTAACKGRVAGEPCTTEAMGQVFSSLCMGGPDGLFCPRTEADRLEACFATDTCELDGVTGSCTTSYEGVPICITRDEAAALGSVCSGKGEGDPCFLDDPAGPGWGTCENQGRNLSCRRAGEAASWGALDGVNVDGCGQVYATEYILGRVYRIQPDTGRVELAAETGSSWIPNLHWGNGIGGWRTDVLYIMDRDTGDVIELELGVPGKRDAFWPLEEG